MTKFSQIRGDPCLIKWLDSYMEGDSRDAKTKYFKLFYQWLQDQERLKDLTPKELIEFQENAATKEDKYLILDTVIKYIQVHKWTINTKRTYYSALREFFSKNRAPLPLERINFSTNIQEPKQGELRVEDIETLIKNSDLQMRAIYLTLFQGLMGQEELITFNTRCSGDLVKHLRENEKNLSRPFRISFSGRKRTKGKRPFYTFIGEDALNAIKEYFERERGWPKEGEAIFMNQERRPITKQGTRANHLRLLARLKYIQRVGGSSSTRYGLNLHEFRDQAKTWLHVRGKVDMACVDFWMGHVVDPLGYDKFSREEDYVLGHYLRAQPILNIVSGTAKTRVEELEGHAAELEAKVKLFQNTAVEALKRLDSLDAIVERIKKLEGEKKKSV